MKKIYFLLFLCTLFLGLQLETYAACEHSLTSSVVKAASCSAPGTRRYTCSKCDYTYDVAIKQLEHSYAGTWYANGSAGHYQKCSFCSTDGPTSSHYNFTSLKLAKEDDRTHHSYWCITCGYETGKEEHTMTVTDKYIANDGSYHHTLKCLVCNSISRIGLDCTFSSKVIKSPTCTSTGTRRYTCTVCSQSYDSTISKTSHAWSDWKVSQTEHYKLCDNGCGTESSRGNHIDTNPINGRCDECDYLMYVVPTAELSTQNIFAKDGETAGIAVNVLSGSQPIEYQWYYKESSGGNGILINGATSKSYSFIANKDMNNRYYYCEVSNPAGSCITEEALLTVYYSFTIGGQPQSVNLKKGENATFEVSIGNKGNPDKYTYQWYVASSIAGNGSRILDATNPTYNVAPENNIHEEYYYCIISNGQYDITSSRAKLVADVTLPEIKVGNFTDNITIKKDSIVTIPLIVTDTGEGYKEDNTNFTIDDVIVKINENVNNAVEKTLKYNGKSGIDHNYELSLTNFNENGKISIEIPDGAIEDNFHNKNLAKKFLTNILIDIVSPVLEIESVSGTSNDNYANATNTLVIGISVTEEKGYNINEFSLEDINITVGGSNVNSDVSKKLEYVEKNGSKYLYRLTLSNVKGDGNLLINVPNSAVKDIAGNENENKDLIPVGINNKSVIIDNTKPVINSLNTTIGSYNSGRVYPTSLEARHEEWANEDIYVRIGATDNYEIDCYMKSVGNTETFKKINSNEEAISTSVNDIVYYRVVDKAGNYSEINKRIKLDKIVPDKPNILLQEQRINGALYTYNPSMPTAKSIYVIPDSKTVVDKGSVKSGINENMTYTWYTVSRYKDSTKSTIIDADVKYGCNEGVLLTENGYYEIKMTMEDIAGNSVVSDIFKVLIDKKAENTIKIKNINDIGSGVQRITIKIYSADNVGNKTTEEVITPIVIEEPYKEVIKNVRLGKGKFFVEATLEDKVGNNQILSATIVNTL